MNIVKKVWRTDGQTNRRKEVIFSAWSQLKIWNEICFCFQQGLFSKYWTPFAWLWSSFHQLQSLTALNHITKYIARFLLVAYPDRSCDDIYWPTVRSEWKKLPMLIHWGRVMHICVSKLTIIDSDNGSSPGTKVFVARQTVWRDCLKHIHTHLWS